MKKLFVMVICALAVYAPSVWPDEKVDHAQVRKVAMEFIQAKTLGMPGKVAIKVDDIDPRVALSACYQLEAFLPNGSSMLGKTSIGVRCNERNGWSLFMSASITTTMNMFVSSKPLQQGQIIHAGDYAIQSGEISQPGIVTEETQILGKVIKFSIGAGQLLKHDMFRPPYVVTQGQSVQLFSEGQGFKLRTEGVAMNNAAAGQLAQVKVTSGQIISGTAKSDGIVEMQK